MRVTGTVTEFGTAPNTLTEIGTPTLTPTTTVLSSGNTLPAFITVTLPVAAQGELERYEGMRVRFMQTLTVSDHFDLAHFGEITVTAGGRALQPTNVIDPNDDPASGNTTSGATNVAAINALTDLNRRASVILDGSFQTYPGTIPFFDPMTNTLRLGSTVADVTGVLSQLGGTHRVYPDVSPVFTHAPRPLTPPAVGGNVKVASMNVLNYFNGNGLGGGFPTSRGADSINEFNRQRAKVLAAILGLNADVVGLLEIENDGNDANSSIQDLINGLNTATAPGTWAFIPDPAGYTSTPGGTDLIRPAIIYKTASVAPDGASSTSSDSAFSNGRSPVAQTFRVLSDNEKFTLVVNHFKSKGSGGSGLDADQLDGQGFFNNTRKLQAQALLTFMATLTATPRIITMGDFNAYEQEDPIDLMRAGGFSTLINGDSSYMFDGQSGSLDHALGSAAMVSVVSGAAHWNINADEPIVLDYNVETKNTAGCVTSCTSPDFYAATPFRSADHDPVLVGLLLPGQCQPGYFSATGNSPCTPASPGSFVAMAGATSAAQCIAGSYSSTSAATACTPASAGNFVAMAGATGQTACAAGSYQPNTGTTSCNLADAGNFVAMSGSSTQTACLAGTYQPNTGSTSCNNADPGSFVAGSGATTQTSCLAGSFSAMSGASLCTPASAGNFVAMGGATGQTACLAGTYQPNTGSTSCNLADAGSFVAGTGATTQTACLVGTYQPNTGSSSCNAADAGNFVAGTGATTQTQCLAGTYQGSTGQSSCTAASPGFFVAATGATMQTACAMGTTSIVNGATACIPLFTVTPSSSGNGSIAPATAQSVAQGQTATFTLTPSMGYRISGVSGTCGGTLTGSSYTTAAVIADCSVIADFAPLVTFNIVLEGTQEVPPNVSTGTGSGTAVIDTVDNTITLNLTFSGLTGTVNNAHLHGPADRGVSAGVKFPIGQASPITDIITYSETDEADILAGKWYVNIHTDVYGGGELRGQLDNAGAADKLLNVSVSGTGSGTVTATGINCPGDCAEAYVHNSMVTLTATQATSSTFAGWSGACSGTGSCVVTMDFVKTVAATFTLNTYTVTAGAGANGSISPSGNVSVSHGGTAVFTVTPDIGYSASVGGTCGGSLVGGTYTTNAITADCSVTASFGINSYQLTTSVTGTGSITGTGINCPGDCSEIFTHGAMVTLTAAPGTGYSFSGWGGACSGTGSCTVTMDSAKSVSATFTLNSYTVTASAGANGSIAPSGTVSANHGSTTNFTVTPAMGYVASVGGTCGGSLAGTTYTTAAITSDCTVVASFVPLVTFNIVLEGAQETPANNSAGVGSGTAVIDTVNNTITLNLTFSGLTGTVNNAHLHGPAMRGMAAGVKIGISQTSPIADVLTYSETDEADILAGLWYVNIHSTVFPGGELRGQIDNLGAADKTLTVSVTGTGTVTGHRHQLSGRLQRNLRAQHHGDADRCRRHWLHFLRLVGRMQWHRWLHRDDGCTEERIGDIHHQYLYGHDQRRCQRFNFAIRQRFGHTRQHRCLYRHAERRLQRFCRRHLHGFAGRQHLHHGRRHRQLHCGCVVRVYPCGARCPCHWYGDSGQWPGNGQLHAAWIRWRYRHHRLHRDLRHAIGSRYQFAIDGNRANQLCCR